jgi:hypothetical protein
MHPQLSPMEQLPPVQPSSTQSSSEPVIADDLELKLYHLKSLTTDFATLTKEMKDLHQNPDEYWYAMGTRLQTIISKQLYRTGGYRSFSEYCIRCLGYSRQHAYKLINVVQFIDEQFLQAKTTEQREMVRRLFSLGFTKLYILHPLSPSILEDFLMNGVEWTVAENQSVYIIPLEAVTIGQLKQVLAQKVDKDVRKKIPFRPLDTSSATALLNVQAKTLLRLFDQFCNELDNSEVFSESISTIKDYALSLIQALTVLSGNNLMINCPVDATALVMEPDDELFTILQQSLSIARIRVQRVNTIEEAKQFKANENRFVVLPAEALTDIDKIPLTKML